MVGIDTDLGRILTIWFALNCLFGDPIIGSIKINISILLHKVEIVGG